MHTVHAYMNISLFLCRPVACVQYRYAWSTHHATDAYYAAYSTIKYDMLYSPETKQVTRQAILIWVYMLTHMVDTCLCITNHICVWMCICVCLCLCLCLCTPLAPVELRTCHLSWWLRTRTQLFAVVRHTERADGVFAFWEKGRWSSSEDCRRRGTKFRCTVPSCESRFSPGSLWIRRSVTRVTSRSCSCYSGPSESGARDDWAPAGGSAGS